MIEASQLRSLPGKTLLGAGDDKLGKVAGVYESVDGSGPTFVTVTTGLFGGHASFVPVTDAQLRGDDLVVPYDKEQVKNAPRIADDAELSPEEEDRLYQHYGVGASSTGAQTSHGAGQDVSGPNTDDAMTRSEERLQVGTQKVETGRARLRKYVVTENETVQVPVTKEKVTVEREPITEQNIGAATDGPAISEEEHEIVLTEERPVVAKEAVPVERVRLGKEAVQEQATVSEEVRKEQIETEGVQQR